MGLRENASLISHRTVPRQSRQELGAAAPGASLEERDDAEGFQGFFTSVSCLVPMPTQQLAEDPVDGDKGWRDHGGLM